MWCGRKSGRSDEAEQRRMRDMTEPGGVSLHRSRGGGSAGGRAGVIESVEGGKLGAGSGGGNGGSELAETAESELGVWSNRTHPVGPYPSQVESWSGRSDSGQHSQSIAWSSKSSVMF